MKIHRKTLSDNDYGNAGNLCELMFLGMVMINNIGQFKTTILVVFSGAFAFLGLVLIGRGFAGDFKWLYS